jgi:ribosomal protein S18 acetylase RimI-like enzyme
LVCKDCLDEYIKDFIDAIYKDEDTNRFVVKEENKIIGFVQWTEKGIPEIIDIMVLPERQNKGYGREILNQVLTGLKARGFRKVRVGVFKSNSSARHLYEKIGFKPIQMVIAMFWIRNE